jgi:endonuclease/exonuclease/phosphatase family metal-dependent hydrolase
MVKSPHKGWLILKIILLAINLGAVIALFLSYGAFYIDPRSSWIFSLFGLLYPWILLFNIICIIFWLLFWKKYIWISIIAILIGWKQLNALFAINYDTQVMPPATTINVMTYNVHGFYGPINIHGKFRTEILEFLQGEHADILCLQEFHIREAQSDPVIKHMARKLNLPYAVALNYYANRKFGGINGLAIFSKYPIVYQGSLSLKNDSRFAIFADLVVEQDTIRVFNVHLASLHLNQNDVDFYYKLKEQNTSDVDMKKGTFSILKKLKSAFLLRAEQTDLLQYTIDNAPYPVIVCGDMNDSPYSYTYNILTDHLTDSYREAGKGFLGNTYDGPLPNYRIDYIMHDQHFTTYSYSKSEISFSDHYPVQTILLVE